LARKLLILAVFLLLAYPVASLDSVAFQCDPATDPECNLPPPDNNNDGPVCDPADPECDATPDTGNDTPTDTGSGEADGNRGEISDRDRDGVPDNEDVCPDTFGERPNGCPLGNDNPNIGFAEANNSASSLQVSVEDGRDAATAGLTEFQLLDNCVAINEVLWAGTTFSENHHYIELHNNCNVDIDLMNTVLLILDKQQGGTRSINLQGTILRDDYFLIVNNSFVVSDVQPDFEADFELQTTNTALLLVFREGEQVLSTANFASNPPDEAWYAGAELTDGTRISMERNENAAEDNPSSWHSNNQRTRNGLDAVGIRINGTPKQPNSPAPIGDN